MTSTRKLKSNRANAKLSTGPQTALGKARAAKNAYYHGLSISIFTDPFLSRESETLAQKIVGERAKADLLNLARDIAEAQIDLLRIRRARGNLLARDLDLLTTDAGNSKKAMSVLSEIASECIAMDRYERRALSRRKFAIRALDAVRAQART